MKLYRYIEHFALWIYVQLQVLEAMLEHKAKQQKEQQA